MKDISRRSLLKAAGALPALRTLVASSSLHSLKSIGVQLYSVRDVIANNDPAEVLKSRTEFTHDPAALYRWRDTLAAAIAKAPATLPKSR